MQTFLPYANFAKSAKVLDRQRLGKQRVENLQLMSAIVCGTGWISHPATEMWRKNAWALLEYQKAICNEWVARGYQDTCLEKTTDIYMLQHRKGDEDEYPWWIGNRAFHVGHKSNLMRKDPEYYGQFFGKDFPQDKAYLWPSSEMPNVKDRHPAILVGS